MEKVKLYRGYDNELSFNISISGDSNLKVEEARLLLSQGDWGLYVLGVIENDKLVFKLASVLDMLQCKDYPMVVEVFVQGQKFVPYQSIVEVCEPVKLELQKQQPSVEFKVELRPIPKKEVDAEGTTVSEEKSRPTLLSRFIRRGPK